MSRIRIKTAAASSSPSQPWVPSPPSPGPPTHRGPIFGDLPVLVLQAPRLPFLPGLTHRYREATVAAIGGGIEEFVAESRHGTLIKVEDTGHNIQDDQPQVVMDAILDVIGR